MRKKAVELPGVTLGEGMPKVCVPVMGEDARALRAATDAARAQADLIELRLDSVSPEMDAARLRAACRTVREAAQGTAILATMRTARDGGAGDADVAHAALESVCRAVAGATEQALRKYPGLPVVCSGGVSSNSMLRREMARFDAVFGAPQYSTDNAMGVAVLGRMLEGA